MSRTKANDRDDGGWVETSAAELGNSRNLRNVSLKERREDLAINWSSLRQQMHVHQSR